MKEIKTKIAGTSFNQEAVKQLKPGDELVLVPEPDNKYDPKATKITTTTGLKLGYIGKSKDLNQRVHEELKHGKVKKCFVIQVTGTPDQTLGVNIQIEVQEDEEDNNQLG